MINTIFGNYIYATIFYFFVFMPLYSLIFIGAIKNFQKKDLGFEKSFVKNFINAYAACFISSLFATSLAYMLIFSKTYSYYFIFHFFLAVPLVSLLISLIISKIGNKISVRDWFSFLTLVLNSLSLFITIAFLGLKYFAGRG